MRVRRNRFLKIRVMGTVNLHKLNVNVLFVTICVILGDINLVVYVTVKGAEIKYTFSLCLWAHKFSNHGE